MIQIANTETYGWEAAIRGMRNPMNSWNKSDSGICYEAVSCHTCQNDRNNCDANMKKGNFVIGYNDLDLMKRLSKAGTDHRKYLRMIAVYCDITAPLYWWKEFDTYKIGTVANSCSTMHKIHAKRFSIDDFSHEHLDVYREHVMYAPTKYRFSSTDLLELEIAVLNQCRDKYLETKDKKYWWQMIQLLPSSYNQKRTVMLNYEVLANIYKSRRNHKLEEWHDFCDWIEKLPYSRLITREE